MHKCILAKTGLLYIQTCEQLDVYLELLKCEFKTISLPIMPGKVERENVEQSASFSPIFG